MVIDKLVVTFQPGFEQLAARDLFAADPAARADETLAAGLWCLSPAPDDRDARRLVRRLAEVIAFRHLHPVERDARTADLATLVGVAASLGDRLDPTRRYAVQTRLVHPASTLPKAVAINDAVAGALSDREIPYDRRAPEQVLSITVAGDRVLAGVGITRDNLSAWPGGARRFARADAPSRSQHKLLEALEVFDVAPTGRALDLGAAPGGWTEALAQRGLDVTAVDPAALDPRIGALPGVTVYRGSAERFLASRSPPAATFDWVVSDMRMDARDAARLLVSYASLLTPSGRVLTTLKLPTRGYLPVLDAALDILGRGGYRRLAARQLFHNRAEVTVLLGRSA